jgi:hypothetical protein
MFRPNWPLSSVRDGGVKESAAVLLDVSSSYLVKIRRVLSMIVLLNYVTGLSGITYQTLGRKRN